MEQYQIPGPIDWLWPGLPASLDTNWFGFREKDLLRWFQNVPGLRTAMILRQVHALEHATVSLLDQTLTANTSTSDQGHSVAVQPQDLGGMTTEQGFYIYGPLRRLAIVRAAKEALERLTQGDWQLAIHPRCGTNWPIQLALQSGLIFGLHLLLPKEPIEQLMGFSLATSLASELAPEVEALWQQYVMTATPFNLEIVEINAVTDEFGLPAHFVRVEWVDEDFYHA